MKAFKYTPEGWNSEVVRLKEKGEINQYIENKNILQGIVESCDNSYNQQIN